MFHEFSLVFPQTHFSTLSGYPNKVEAEKIIKEREKQKELLGMKKKIL